MLKPAGTFTYKTTDNQETVAATASMGLLHWYMRKLPKLGDEPVLEVPSIPMYIMKVVSLLTGKGTPGPYDPNFFTVVIGCIERTYGKAPEISSDFLTPEWYSNLPERLNDHKIVVQARRNADPKVVAYEEVCLGILKWLAKYGDIIDLEEP
jgi:hypothetical protein